MCHRHYDIHAEALREEKAERERNDPDEPDEDEDRVPAVADD